MSRLDVCDEHMYERHIRPETSSMHHIYANSCSSMARNALLNMMALVCMKWHRYMVPPLGVPHPAFARTIRVDGFDILSFEATVRHWWTRLWVKGPINRSKMKRIIKKCQQMDSLDVSSNNPFGSPDYRCKGVNLFKMPQLTSLNIDNCQHIDDDCIRDIVKGCPKLARFSMCFCDGVTDGALLALAMLKGTLRQLMMACCTKLTGAGLAPFLETASQLELFDLCYCENIAVKSLEQLAVYCPLLTQVHLSGCTQLTDDCIEALAKGCGRVSYLGIELCNQLTDRTLGTITKSWLSVREIRINGCNMTPGAIGKLPSMLKASNEDCLRSQMNLDDINM